MYLSIDVGGTKTLIALFDNDGAITEQVKFPTNSDLSIFTRDLDAAISKIAEKNHIEAASIGLPGVINRELGVVEKFGNLSWAHVPIAEIMTNIIDCPLFIDNDAKLAGLAEAEELKDLYHRILYVTVSTGIGLGLVVDGKIDYSLHDAGGKAILLEHQGKLMAWEEFASGKAIVAKTGKMASEITEEHDWYLVARNIAIGLMEVIVLLNPDCVVIGGGVGTHLPKFVEKLHEELEIYRSPLVEKLPQIKQAAHPEEAVVYGGYLLCKQNEPH